MIDIVDTDDNTVVRSRETIGECMRQMQILFAQANATGQAVPITRWKMIDRETGNPVVVGE